VSSSAYLTSKTLAVPVSELGQVHYILSVVLWANVVANIPFDLVLGAEQVYILDSVFDSLQLTTCMFLHLLFNRVLSFGVRGYKKYYLAAGLYCYLCIFVMLVTRDVLRHVLVTLRQEDGQENVDH